MKTKTKVLALIATLAFQPISVTDATDGFIPAGVLSAQILAPRSAEAEAIKSIFSHVKSPDSLNKDSIAGPFSDATLKAQQVIRNVMSPYCPGLSLEACPSPEANVLRNEIRRVVAAGYGEEEVRTTLVKSYGSAVLGIPPDDGFGKFAWAMPFLALAAAGTLVTIWLQRRVRKVRDKEVADSPSVGNSHDPELLDRLNEEMKRG